VPPGGRPVKAAVKMMERKVMQKMVSENGVSGKLLNAQQLLDALFDAECRPSMRWLRSQTKARAIPHIRLGHLVFFDLEMVRSALAARNLVRGRMVPAANASA
jgi:hypothetical protein